MALRGHRVDQENPLAFDRRSRATKRQDSGLRDPWTVEPGPGGDRVEDAGPARRTGESTAVAGAGATLARLTVGTLITCSAGIMAAGFLHWRAGALVAGLTALSFVLVGTAPARRRFPAPYGRGRLLRELRRHGYRIVPDGAGRFVAVGPGGVYLLDTRTWAHQVSRGPNDWRIGARPAARAVRQAGERAERLERLAHSVVGAPVPRVVPVIMVVGRLPEPVMRVGDAVIARPRGAVQYLTGLPEVLARARVDTLAAAMARQLNGR